MTATPTSTQQLTRQVLTRAVLGFLLLAAVFFGTAGTFAYWQAWLYLAVLFIPLLSFVFYFLKHDPALLARRMEAREQQTTQKWIVALGTIPYLLAFSLPGLSVRFGWPMASTPAVLLGALVVLLAYGLFIVVMVENRYAARTIRVEEGQPIITSGPYHWVRHPMYVSAILLTVFSPLALGSYWAMLPALLIIPVMAVRIVNEEKLLEHDLPGYTAYEQQTKSRLVPGVW